MSDSNARPGSGGSASINGPQPPSAWRRLLWLLLPVGYWLVASRVPLPGVDSSVLGPEPSWVAGQRWSLLSLGFSPLVAGYLLVEAGAAVVPSWRPLRQTRPGRGTLARAA